MIIVIITVSFKNHKADWIVCSRKFVRRCKQEGKKIDRIAMYYELIYEAVQKSIAETVKVYNNFFIILYRL